MAVAVPVVTTVVLCVNDLDDERLGFTGRGGHVANIHISRKHLGDPLVESSLVMIRGIDPIEEPVLSAHALEHVEERDLQSRKFTDCPLRFSFRVSTLAFSIWSS